MNIRASNKCRSREALKESLVQLTPWIGPTGGRGRKAMRIIVECTKRGAVGEQNRVDRGRGRTRVPRGARVQRQVPAGRGPSAECTLPGSERQTLALHWAWQIGPQAYLLLSPRFRLQLKVSPKTFSKKNGRTFFPLSQKKFVLQKVIFLSGTQYILRR